MIQLKDGSTVEDPRLGRIPPPDDKHIRKFPARAALPETAQYVERSLYLPRYRHEYNQGTEGACVGFSTSWSLSILNHRLYGASWLYHEAQKVDAWPGGVYEGADPQYEGTEVRAALEVTRTVGHRRQYGPVLQDADIVHGIKEYRWATTIDEIRTSIAMGIPVILGVNWYSNFDDPEGKGHVRWVGRGDLGRLRGGHAITVYGASDSRAAFKLVNSWGMDYPLVWIPYDTIERLLRENGEAALISDL